MDATPADAQNFNQSLEPSVSLHDLKQVGRIGLALAIDWIAMRGQSMTLQDYNQRQDEAMRDFVDVLAKTPAALVRQIILGTALEDQASNEKPVDPSIFLDMGVLDADFDLYSWQLLLVDSNSEDTGQIISMRGSRNEGWRNLNVSTVFLLEHWPPIGQAPRRTHKKTSKTELKTHLEEICIKVPVEFQPLSQTEIVTIANKIADRPPRVLVREIAKELVKNLTPGPRLGKRGERKTWFEGFLKMIAASQSGEDSPEE